MRPVPKVTAATAAGAFVVVVAWALDVWAGVDVPSAVAAAATTVLAFVAGYFAPRDPRPEVEPPTTDDGA